MRGYEDNLGEPLRAVREDVEREWEGRVEREVKAREEKEAWAGEVVRQLEKERKMRMKLEEERRALAAFVSKFDSLGLGALTSSSKLRLRKPSAAAAEADPSPIKIELAGRQPNLLEQMPEEEWSMVEDMSFDERDFKAGAKLRAREKEGKENVPVA